MAKITTKPIESQADIAENQSTEDTSSPIKSQIEILTTRLADLQKARTQVVSVPQTNTYADKTVEEIQQISKDTALEQLAADNQRRGFDEAIASTQSQIAQLTQQLHIASQQQRVAGGLTELKRQAQLANQKLTEAKQAVLEVKAIANSIGRDCLEINGRIPFENRWDLTAGFPQVEIYEKCVVLNSQLFPVR